VIIKPARQGSSIGIKICKDCVDLVDCLKYSFQYDNRLIVEQFINVNKEVNIALFKDKDSMVFSNTEQPIYTNEILDFDDKYMKNCGGFDTIKRLSPADIDNDIENEIKFMASKVYSHLDMFGVVRFDFIIDQDNKIFLNEVNSIPGSMANYLFGKDCDYKKLIDKIILNSLIRDEQSELLIKKFDSEVLEHGINGLKK